MTRFRAERGVALAATLHDASGALRGTIRRHLPALRALYGAITVTTSPPTHASVQALLAELGVHGGTPRTNARGPLYRLALRRALASGAPSIHYLDFDRALHWVETRPRELAAVLRLATRFPAVLLGRTVAAHRSHHRALFETECAANRALAARLGTRRRVDLLVPSFLLSRPLTRALVRRSRARDASLYGEWPALLATLGEPLVYHECRGLDWETPDRARAAVRRLGLVAWRCRFDTPAEWRLREAMAGEFLRGCDAALARSASTVGRRPRLRLRRQAGRA
ncbi:MAG TPA: hypothetical protein VGK30_15310 [Candidatus Binatia bacterium]|jgi:hypothetical protein